MTSGRSVLVAVVHARTPHEDGIGDAVASVAGLADNVVVAGAAGIVVPDAEDTPAVRRAVELATTEPWVLWMEPHERAAGDRWALRCVLAATDAPALRVRPLLDSPWPEAVGRLRLTRARTGEWEGRTRTRLLDGDGVPVPGRELPDAAFVLRQAPSAHDLRERDRRLDDVARAGRDVAASEGGAAHIRALLALGQCLLVADQLPQAVEVLAAVAEAGSEPGALARDLLARVALQQGRDAEALGHAQRLDGEYGSWLAAQALAQLGDVARAWDLVRDLEETSGPDGLAVPSGVLHEIRALLAFASGHPGDAADLMATAMATDGQVAGRGALLREMCALAGRDLDTECLLARALPEHRDALARELAQPRVAA